MLSINLLFDDGPVEAEAEVRKIIEKGGKSNKKVYNWRAQPIHAW